MVLALIRKHDGQGADRVALSLAEVTVFLHLVQHMVAALQRLFRIDGGVVAGRLVDNAHKAGALLDEQIAGLLVEIGACGRIDAVSFAAEEDGVQIHGHDLVLGVVALQLDGGDPFLELVLDKLEVLGSGKAGGSLVAGEEGLGQLLGDGAAAALAGIAHHDGLHGHAGKGTEVDAGMLAEAGVLGGDRRVDERFRQLVEGYIRAVFYMVCIENFAVAADQLGGQIRLWILQFFKRWDLGKNTHQKQAQGQDQERRHKQDPPPFDYFFLGFKLHFRIGLKCEFSN